MIRIDRVQNDTEFNTAKRSYYLGTKFHRTESSLKSETMNSKIVLECHISYCLELQKKQGLGPPQSEAK